MRLASLLLSFLSTVASAQFTYVVDQQIPVAIGNQQLQMPWAGGLNTAQFNAMDLNYDGKEDLVIYERMADRVITFLHDNNAYRYAPEYEVLFPEEITGWLVLRDYNGDGLKDIFTGDNLGIKVFTNTTAGAEQPFTWKRFLFSNGVNSVKSEVLLTKGISFKVNLQLNFDDLPAFADADGDGDLDIFNPSYSNSSAIEYHRNYSAERYGTLDSLDFERVTQLWGNVRDCGCGNFTFNNSPCNTGGRVTHAGGKSILAFDADGDGDLDLTYSESDCSTLYLLRNTGTVATPVVTSGVPYPQNSPASFQSYPSAYYQDVDFDNIPDLLVSPNLYTRESLLNNFNASVWFYKNSNGSAPNFSNPNTNFLQEDMIDVGDNAVPAFFDADGDGDLDLFIGNYSVDFSGTLFYFENTGSARNPSYQLITPDYLNLSFYNLINVRPQFADMDSDGKTDLAFTATSLFNGVTQLYYFKNQSTSKADFISERIPAGFTIFPFENVYATHVDDDTQIDLLVGRQNGALEFWRNTGGNPPGWQLADDTFLGIGGSVLRQYPAASTGDLNADGKADLIFGDQRGSISIISNFKEAVGAPGLVTDIVYNPLLEEFVQHNLGGRIWPTIANIFNSDKPAIIVGNVAGGVTILRHDESIPLPRNPEIVIYPNPVNQSLSTTVTIRVDRPGLVQVYNLFGQPVGKTFPFVGFQNLSIDLLGLTKGIYLLKFAIQGKTFTLKIVLD